MSSRSSAPATAVAPRSWPPPGWFRTAGSGRSPPGRSRSTRWRPSTRGCGRAGCSDGARSSSASSRRRRFDDLGGRVMRAMVVERYGAPLRMADLPVPTPGLRQVLVRVIGCGICRSDLKVVAGAMSFSPTLPLPHVPGHEISGEIAALGQDARGRVGDRVVVYHYWPCGACAHCQVGEETLCTNLAGWVGFATPGGFQEYLAVPDDCVLPLPQNIPPEHGGPLTCALGTAYQAVVSRGVLRAGETAVVLGAGGVGLQAVQVARVSGASVFAVDIHPHRLRAAREAGAQDVFPADEAASERVRAATGGRGADLVIDTVGYGGSLAASTGLVRTGGRIVV